MLNKKYTLTLTSAAVLAALSFAGVETHAQVANEFDLDKMEKVEKNQAEKEDQVVEEKEEQAAIDPDASFEKLEDAIANAEAFLKASPNVGYEIVQGVDGKYYATFSLTDDRKIVPQTKVEDSAKPVEEEKEEKTNFNPDQPYDNLADAVVAAETALANDDVNKGYDISLGADGKYYIALTPEENNDFQKLFDFSKKEDKADEEFVFDPSVGYDNLADAFIAAEKAVANDEVNQGYDISLGADGKYYIALKVEENNELAGLFDFNKKEEGQDQKEEKTEEQTEEKTEGKEEAEVDPTAEFDKLEDAIANAEAFLKQSENVGYTIAKGADGKYYAQFSLTDDSKVVPSAELEPAKKEKKEFKDLFDFDKMKEKHKEYNAKKEKEKESKVERVENKKDQASQPKEEVKYVKKESKGLPRTGVATAGLGLGAAAILAGLGLAMVNKKDKK